MVVIVGYQLWDGCDLGPKEIKRNGQCAIVRELAVTPGFRRRACQGQVIEPAVLQFVRPTIVHVAGVLGEKHFEFEISQARFLPRFSHHGVLRVFSRFDRASWYLDSCLGRFGMREEEQPVCIRDIGVDSMACFHLMPRGQR